MKHSIALVAMLAPCRQVSVQAMQEGALPTAGTLPTNTEVLVTLNDELTSKTTHKGQLFDVSVSRDVMADGHVIIPRGTPGKREIVRRTGKGAFGKSGKMEVVLRELAIDGRALPLTGRFRQEGQGNTGAVLGTVVLAGVIAGAFVTGHSAVIEQGREIKAFTAQAWPVAPRLQVATPPPPVVPVAVAVLPARARPAPLPPAPSPAALAAAVATPKPAVFMPTRETIAIVRPVSVVTPVRAVLPATQEAPDPSAAYQRRLSAPPRRPTRRPWWRSAAGLDDRRLILAGLARSTGLRMVLATTIAASSVKPPMRRSRS